MANLELPEPHDLFPPAREAGLPMYRFRRDWDAAAWPYATKGFFPFKKHIPELLERAGLA